MGDEPRVSNTPRPRATLRGCFTEMFTYLAVFLILVGVVFVYIVINCSGTPFGPSY